ncbi:MAG TPA: MFS transporter [Gaiellaceae bacterium]
MTRVRSESIFAPAYRSATTGIVLLMTLLAFEAMAISAALPTATRDLHAVGSIGWAFTGFLAASLVGMVVSGQVSDRRGPRRPTIAGLVSFMVGLALSGSASSIEQFVAGRCVQGLGAGLLITAIYIMLGEAFPAELRPKLFAALSSAWVVPSLVGPIIAGTLAQHASWRWVFLGLLPLAAVGAALMIPVLRRLPDSVRAGTESPRSGSHRILRAFGAAGGVAALEAAGQHPALVSIVPALAGLTALVWGLRALLPPGTIQARPGVTAPIAMRGLLAGALFGAESLIPLMLQVQHRYHATAAALPLVVAGVAWAASSWWQGREQVDSPERRLVLIRLGFGLVAVGIALIAAVSQPQVPGWLSYPAWIIAGLGAGIVMPSVGVLLLRYTSDARRGADTAALQLADASSSALTTGIGGVVVAAAARGALGYTAAFAIVDASMIALALLGIAAAGRGRAPGERTPVTATA